MPEPGELALIRALADGRWHSGETLADRAGVSRAAIWKRLQKLTGFGLEVEAVRGKGYRLERALDLLDADAIRARLPATLAELPLRVHETIGSTNRDLLDSDLGHGLCLAEHQSAGRGRRGRDWYSPFGQNLYVSVLWTFPDWPPRLTALGLSVAIAVVRALRGLGVPAGIKWPNDLYLQGRKLGGLLIEQRGEQGGPCRVVVGIGINLHYDERADVGQPWAAVDQVLGDFSRNQFAAAVIQAITQLLREFETSGPVNLSSSFRELDVYADRDVVVRDQQRELRGRACGIDEFGRLRLLTADGELAVAVGDLSLRPD